MTCLSGGRNPKASKVLLRGGGDRYSKGFLAKKFRWLINVPPPPPPPPPLPPAAEAVHLANLLCRHGFFFCIEGVGTAVKDDGSLFRFQVSISLYVLVPGQYSVLSCTLVHVLVPGQCTSLCTGTHSSSRSVYKWCMFWCSGGT